MTVAHTEEPRDLRLRGLPHAEANKRLAEHGANALPEPKGLTLLGRIGRQLRSPIIYVLAFALLFDLGSWLYQGRQSWPIEGIAIGAILVLNTVLGVFQEYRSEQVLARLKLLAAPEVWVVRDGALARVPSRQLVPGDVVRLEAGDRVPADAQLLSGQGILVDESVLTGESMAVDKRVSDELLSGTLVVRGKGYAEVARTGIASNMGKLAALLGKIEVGKTPLERRLDVFGNRVAMCVGGLAIVLITAGVALEGLSRADEWFLFAVALAVAVVPEGLPAVLTLTLALGVQRMARRHTVVRRLAAVEALGSVTVIATDKTGTLTENRMAVHTIESTDAVEATRALVLANDADASGAGDPLEIGLLEHARATGVDIAALRSRYPRLGERPFDSAWKFMRVTVGPDGIGYFKGAPEVLLERAAMSSSERLRWTRRTDAAAADGYRVLGLARGIGEQEEGLDFLGLVLLWDPPRPEVLAALESAQTAGIRVVMITGDHPATAVAAATAIGLRRTEVLLGSDVDALANEALVERVGSVGVFARVNPEHKLRIVEALKAAGEIVAVTGDGVNDAPALKRADVGVAMGQRGSDVAREVADLVLTDDNFASIVAAIEEGRSIYQNLQKFIRYTFSTNVALLLLLIAGTAVCWAYGLRDAAGMLVLPLTATQLLWINFLGDGPPALALALDRNPGTMTQPPRPASSALLDRGSVWFIVASGAFKGGAGIALLVTLAAGGAGIVVIQTAVFLAESAAKLVSAYPARRTAASAPRRNWILDISIGLGLSLQIATAFVPQLRRMLGLTRPHATSFVLVLAVVLFSWLSAEAVNRIIGARQESRRSRPRGRRTTEKPIAA